MENNGVDVNLKDEGYGGTRYNLQTQKGRGSSEETNGHDSVDVDSKDVDSGRQNTAMDGDYTSISEVGAME